MDLSKTEQSRTYAWFSIAPPPSIRIVQPQSVEILEDGTHIVEGSDNCVYVMRNFSFIKTELIGGVAEDAEAKIVVG